MSRIIEVSDLDFSYEKALVLQHVNVSIFQGEFIGIFGPNGGGKTTFLKLLMGFLKPNKGKILLFDMQPKAARKRVGYVPQVARYDRQFPISVLELVLMGCLSEAYWWGGYRADAKKKAVHALSRVGLADKQEQAFGTLSGGQAQRALIARALVNDPELLLLDEPTASVDPNAEKEIYQILSELKNAMTIVMVTHDLQAIVPKVDRLICVNRDATPYKPAEVCEHFALGLYHPPIRL